MVIDLFDAHRVAGKHLADVDLAALIADPAAGGDDCRPIMVRVVEILELAVAPLLSRGRLAGAHEGSHDPAIDSLTSSIALARDDAPTLSNQTVSI